MPCRRRVGLMLELDWPYDRHFGVFSGTQRYAAECDRWDCVVDELAHDTLRDVRGAAPYDGIIARATHPLAVEAQRLGVPIVNTWFDSPADHLPCVAPDFVAVGHLAAEHLLGLGLRRFACLSIRKNKSHARMLSAFHAAINEAGYTCQCVSAAADFPKRAHRRQRFHRDISEHIATWKSPLGVYSCFEDITTRYVTNACRTAGLRIPDDVALVAGVSETILCQHPSPSLTSIAVSYDEVGYQAAKMLDRIMDGGPPPERPLILPPIGVSARQSTNFMAVDDELVRAALQFMTAPGHKRVTVADVAREASASRRTLERRFVATLGRTVAEQIRLLRIDRAKRHLADPSLSIKAVAHMCGFPNVQRLYEAFHRHEGTSPAQHRAARALGTAGK